MENVHERIDGFSQKGRKVLNSYWFDDIFSSRLMKKATPTAEFQSETFN
jgi:hypothetical protein